MVNCTTSSSSSPPKSPTIIAFRRSSTIIIPQVINYLDVSEDVFLSLDLLSETKDVFGTTRQDWRASEEARLEALVAADAGPDPTRAKDDRAPPPPAQPRNGNGGGKEVGLYIL